MKNFNCIFVFIILLIGFTSCKSSYNDENTPERVFSYHIGVVENFMKAGYIDDDTSLRKSIAFLEKLTSFKSDFDDGYVMFYEPSKKNIKDWKKWFRKNKDNLYWDDTAGELILKE